MWFGDLVTMRWWNGIWLNEAFATFMEIACSAAFQPDWQRWTTFSLERSIAFDVDSLASTRSVEFPVEAPHECEGMFDVLTYQKGGSLLRMLEQYLGEEEFRRGVSHYLTVHEYGNTETSDLWDAIEEANRVHPGAQADGQLDLAAGLPARLGPARRVDARPRAAALLLRRDGRHHDVRRARAPAHRRRRPRRCCSRAASCASRSTTRLPPSWSTPAGHGFMRVAYDDALRARLLGDALAEMTVIERYNLVDDAWNAVVAGRLDAADFLTFVEGFGAERELAVWQAIGIGLRGVGRLLDGEPYAAFQRRVDALVAPVMADLGWEARPGETDLTKKLRGLLVGMLAVLGNDADAQARCRAILAGAPSDPELVAAATSAVAVGRHRRRLRRVPGQVPQRADAAGAAALPLRAGRVPDGRADPAHHRPGVERRGQDAGRPVPAQPVHRQPRQRDDGVERGPSGLGRGQRAASRATRSCGWSTR